MASCYDWQEFCWTPEEAYAARDSLLAIARAISFFFAPATNRARINRSIETAGSLASILATRDWLERRRFAKSLWERPWSIRHFFRLSLNVSLSSTNAASSSDSARNSLTEPTFQPADSRRFFRRVHQSVPLSQFLDQHYVRSDMSRACQRVPALRDLLVW